MENKHIPGQEPESIPPVPEAEEEILIIEELDFSDPVSEAEPELPADIPAAPESEAAETILLPTSEDTGEVPLIPEQLPAEAALIPAESPVEENLISEAHPADDPSVSEGIPSQQEGAAYPEEEPAFILGTLPEVPVSSGEEPEAQMPALRNLEPDPALEILNDPEFSPPQVLPQIPEDVNDQEYRDSVPEPQPEPVPAAGGKKKKDTPRPTLKGRPKRKKGEGLFGIPNILATCVWLSLILVIGITLGRMLWICAADVLAFGRPDQKVTVTVYEADTMEDVIDKLHAGGLIRYKSLFKLYADISDAEEDIQPGIYDLNTRYDYHALVNFMSPSSTREVIELTIPEGYTCRQIYALLEEKRVCTSVDIASYAADGELSDYWFLENVERGSEYCLEGFLFPDTYQFYKNSSPREALEKMLDNFDYRFSEEMRAQIDTLNAEVTGGGYGVREIVIVASLIEKESAAPGESPNIASVIYNRLHNWDYPALLNIDAAIVYAQGGEADTIDTSIDSPYNTYRYTGLTPTPISNPGLSSLKAALNPESTDYYFYVLNPDTGMHQFSTTQTEHDAWIAEFYD